MEKKQIKMFEEMRKLELKTFQDVFKFAQKINRQRRENAEKKIVIKYPKDKTFRSFKTDLALRVIIKEHTKNGKITGCA